MDRYTEYRNVIYVIHVVLIYGRRKWDKVFIHRR